jgi:hypothetical protein
VGWALRAQPLVTHGALRYPLGYDEGVYFASAALLARGVVPYRDFVLVQPWGLEWVLAPLTRVGSLSASFGLCRWAMTVVGGLNVWLVGRVVWRWCGWWPGVAAALVYATSVETVAAERTVSQQPLLTLLCLVAVCGWMGRWRPWLVGVVLGLAVVVKLWASLVVAALLAVRRDGWRGLLCGVAGSLVVALGPAVALAPRGFVDQVVWFQLARPADGYVGVWSRLRVLAGVGTHPLVAGFALVGLVVGWRSVLGRIAVVWLVLVLAVCLLSSTFYTQYVGVAVAPAALLAGVVVERVAQARWRSVLVAAAVGVVVIGVGFDGVVAWRDGRRTSAVLGVISAAVRGRPGCVFSFEPEWLIQAGRLPDVRRSGPGSVDPYGSQLLAVVLAGRRYPNATAAFSDPASAGVADRAVDGCPVVVLGFRGRVQLGRGQPAFEVAYRQPGAADVWVRR